VSYGEGSTMNFWEQFILGTVLSILHGLKIDPARVKHLGPILTDIYDGIGAIMGFPPRVPPTM
jgi:hypothetical protein